MSTYDFAQPSLNRSDLTQTNLGEWVSNAQDPNNPFTQYNISLEYDGGTRDEQWQHYLSWIKQYNIGPPQASDVFSVEQMQKAGLVGLYRKGD